MAQTTTINRNEGDIQAMARLRQGVAIPAHPLALTVKRTLDERRQRALSRYYLAAGAGGLAVGVHTTQFAIRQPKVGLFKPVLELAKEEMDRHDAAGGASGGTSCGASGGTSGVPVVRIGGVCGTTAQAVAEAELLRTLGYHAGLLSLAAMRHVEEEALVDHCRAVGEVLPLVGFYLQPDVGGRVLPYSFWRRFAELPSVAAIKMAPFNRYRTLDVVRAVVDAGREDIALYTGNDDNIVLDLLTPYRLQRDGGEVVERRIVGGLLGHWSVWMQKAATLLEECRGIVRAGGGADATMLAKAVAVTDSNAAFFDAANGFAGCIAGLHEVLRRQGLLEGIWCLDEHETLGPGQMQEIDRVYAMYPELNDDAFVQAHRETWLSG